MGKGTKRARKGKGKLRVPPSTRRPGVVLLGEVSSVPVDIELLALKDLLEQCHRLTRPARLYLAARLQEDVDLF